MQFETAHPRHGKAKFLIPRYYNTEDWDNTILEKKIDVCQPDIIFLCKERFSIIGKKWIEGSPDIVIEILSPSTAYYDLRARSKITWHFQVPIHLACLRCSSVK